MNATNSAAPRLLLWLAALAVLALAGCGDDGESTVAYPFPDFQAGGFDVVTTLVDDQCLDGGLNPLFMPNGADTPWQWPYAITLYPLADLPQTYAIELRAPFGAMTITASYTGGATQGLVSEPNVGVLLGEDRFGQCVADMSADVHLELLSEDHVSGVVTLTMSDPRGDEMCPVDMPASCEVLLTIDATRSAGP